MQNFSLFSVSGKLTFVQVLSHFFPRSWGKIVGRGWGGRAEVSTVQWTVHRQLIVSWHHTVPLDNQYNVLKKYPPSQFFSV